MMTPSTCHTRLLAARSRTRTIAVSIGMALGMVMGAYAPQMAHAATRTKARAKAPATVAPLPDASPEQLTALEHVLLGSYGCEFGKSIQVARDLKNAGYITLQLAKQVWVMKPVLSSTGAIRLEDTRGQTLLLQILTKSMLMDVKSGHRMVDSCVHDTQRAAEENLRANPQPSTFDLAPAAPKIN